MCFSVSVSLGPLSVAGESIHSDHVSRSSTEVSHGYHRSFLVPESWFPHIFDLDLFWCK